MKILLFDLLDATPYHHWMDGDDLGEAKCRRIAVMGILRKETATDYIVAPLMNSLGMVLQVVAIPKAGTRVRQLKITKMECIKEVE